MEKIKLAIVGWGNVGRYTKRVIDETSDMELVGVVRRVSSLQQSAQELTGIPVVSNISELSGVDVAIVSVPSRQAPENVADIMAKGICTVDSFDIHDEILTTKMTLDPIAKSNEVVSIFGAGWDPGTDSMIRAVMRLTAPMAKPITTFGGQKGGRSMGHTAAVKAIDGVVNAVSLTLPNGSGKQKRQVYIQLEQGADFEQVAHDIRTDPYFVHDPTDVVLVDDVTKYDTLNHGGLIESYLNDVQQTYTVEGVNPYMTANVLISSARAAYRAKMAGEFGAYTLIERPLIDFLAGRFEERLKGY